jgi:membrane fusion protein, multidrug efflux system
MPVEMTESRGASGPVDARSADAAVSGAHETRQSPNPPPDQRQSRRRLVIGALGALVVAVAGIFGIPWFLASLNTVSTDDAYVHGHVTFVAPRVAGQITRVLVDDNNRVHKGELLVELDQKPFEDAVAVKRAAVDTAAANLSAAEATVRDIEAQARARRWELQNAIQGVDNKIALLHARVAALDKSRADLTLAQADFYRARRLLGGRPRAARSSTGRKERYRLPLHKSPNRRPKSTKSEPLSDCRRNPMTAGVLTKSRRISIRAFLRSSRRRRT